MAFFRKQQTLPAQQQQLPTNLSGEASSYQAPKASKRPLNLRQFSGWATCLLVIGAFAVPVKFVTEQPGPTFNTIGSENGKELISISGAQTYPVTGQLDMTTVSVAGGPNTTLFGIQALSAWLSSSDTVYPSDVLYAPTTTQEQVTTQNTADMVSSQELAQAAALTYMGKSYTLTLTIQGTKDGGPSAGKFNEGDILTSINGQKINQYAQISDILSQTKTQPVEVAVTRNGSEMKETVTPTYDQHSGKYLLGIYLKQDYSFPMTVTYGLENVGGPSAGMMFALGIIDEMTEKDMTGGKHFAGTGTIDAAGKVGAIGGIAQKMQGAKDNGATVFLAPADNCDEVVGHIPAGLSVVKVSTLKEAADDVTAIGSGTNPASLPTCSVSK